MTEPDPPAKRRSGAVAIAGFRLAVTMFTILPVPARWHAEAATDRAVAAAALRWLPALGMALAALAGLPLLAVDLLIGPQPGRSTPVSATLAATALATVLAVVVLAVLTRGLHLDGLADTTDGLGSRADRHRALEIMRKSDIGAFGVLAIVFTVLLQITALTVIDNRSGPSSAIGALVIAAGTGRLAALHAARPGMPAARPDGFGALVAGSVPAPGNIVVSAGVLLAGALAPLAAALWPVATGLQSQTYLLGISATDVPGVLTSRSGQAIHSELVVRTRPPAFTWPSVLHWPAVQLAALALVALFALHLRRRLGGVTGDVFGALIELTSTATLVGIALVA